MQDLGYNAFAVAWWPYAFILLAGWLPTDIWRWLGVLSAGRIDERSSIVGLARTVATSLVAAVIGRLILFPTGSLAELPDAVRIGAVIGGFLAYLTLGRHTVVAIVVAEVILLGVPWMMGII